MHLWRFFLRVDDWPTMARCGVTPERCLARRARGRHAQGRL